MKSILMTALVMLALPAHAAEGGKGVTVYTTAQGAKQQMVRSQVAAPRPGHPLTEAENSIFVEPQRRFQPFLGIGGAITDATAETFAKLAPARQAELLRAYYDGEAGIGNTLARTTIHSSDFASGSYTYIEEGDKALDTFSIERVAEDTYRVTGAAIERAAAMTYWEHDQSVRRFQRILETIGIDAALREAGVRPGHTVLIGSHELEWSD